MDISHLLWLQGIREAAAPWVEQLFALISAAVVSPALLLIPCLVYWCVDKASGMFALASFTGANLATQTVKGIVCCLRPWVRSPLVHPSALAVTGATGYSFPSGHTTAATSVFGSLGWRFRRHRWLFAACVAVVVLVAFSRNFLGVHTPQDVIGAIVVSVLVMVAVSRVQAWVGAYPVGRRDSIALGSAVALGIAVLVFAFVRAFPVAYAADGTQLVNPVEMRVDMVGGVGYFLGAAVGWFCERRWVRFSTDGPTRDRVVRAAVSLALVAVVMLAMLPPLKFALGAASGGTAGFYAYAFLKAFAPMLCVVWAGPALASSISHQLADHRAV